MNRLVRNSIIFFGIACFSEISYYLYKKIKIKMENDLQKSKESVRRNEINQVMFTNNLSTTCMKWHNESGARKNHGGGDGDKSVEYVCSNPWCYVKNYENIVNLLNSAKKSINLCMYILTCDKIGCAIVAAKARGITVRVISDKGMTLSSGSQIDKFIKNNVPVLISKTEKFIMHHKFCLIDTEWSDNIECVKNTNCASNSNGLLITGSLNWTMQAFTSNCDNLIITTNKELINQYQNEFQRLWIEFGIPD